MARETERIVVSEDGLSLPVIEVLTGRGVIFGKSGSGKSNSASVIVEELLEKGFPLLIIDIEGEYATLKDRYDIVHIGDGDEFDHKLFEAEPDQIVDFCLDQNRPVIIDISDVLEIERAHKSIRNVLRVLFSREKRAQQPFLVIVEEIHEFLPQQGGLDELGETLIRIAKRGRKRGLGLTGMSQRPASVDKDFITQCDWLVWHRLTWENDTRVVKSILGSEKAREVQELETGEAIMMTDWDEAVRRVKFRRKKTADAGDTPTLSPSERRDLTTGRGRSSTSGTSSSGSSSADTTSESRDGTSTSSSSSSADASLADSATEGSTTDDPLAESDAVADPDAEGGDVLVETYPSSQPDAADDTEGTTSGEDEYGMEPAEGMEPAQDAEPVPADADPEDVEIQESTHQEPAVATLWELGQLVTYMLVKFLNSLVYGTRVAVAKATDRNEPVDRLGPIPQQNARPHPDPSRWAMRIVAILVFVVFLLVVFAVITP